MAAKMGDVARLAGVSSATVSHVLNGTRHVSIETRERVQAAIEQSGYRHNSLARALAAGRTRTIGMCVPIRTNPYIADLVNAIETAAGIAGYTLTIGDSRDEEEAEARAIDSFLDRRVDGVILAPGLASETTAIPTVLESGTPLVIIDRRVHGIAVDQIHADNYTAAAGLATHVLSHGYRNVAIARGTPGIQSTDERFDGVSDTLAEAGITVTSDSIVVGHANSDITEAAVAELLGRGLRPEILITLNNAMTIGSMKALRAAGLRVPDDIALACFDDFEWSDLFEPRLTAVSQDVRAIGRGAVELLVARLGDPGLETRDVTVPTTLMVRDSCGNHAPGLVASSHLPLRFGIERVQGPNGNWSSTTR